MLVGCSIQSSQVEQRVVELPANDPNSLAYSTYFVGNERSVQIDNNVYYFTGDQFLTADW